MIEEVEADIYPGGGHCLADCSGRTTTRRSVYNEKQDQCVCRPYRTPPLGPRNSVACARTAWDSRPRHESYQGQVSAMARQHNILSEPAPEVSVNQYGGGISF